MRGSGRCVLSRPDRRGPGQPLACHSSSAAARRDRRHRRELPLLPLREAGDRAELRVVRIQMLSDHSSAAARTTARTTARPQLGPQLGPRLGRSSAAARTTARPELGPQLGPRQVLGVDRAGQLAVVRPGPAVEAVRAAGTWLTGEVEQGVGTDGRRWRASRGDGRVRGPGWWWVREVGLAVGQRRSGWWVRPTGAAAEPGLTRRR